MPAAKRPAAMPAAKPVKPTAAAKPVVASTAKTAMASTAKSAAKPARESAPTLPVPVKAPKVKLVRDSFTMPRGDFELIALLKERALTFKRPTKKSELLRAGLQALAEMNQKQLQTTLDSLPLLKSAHPKKLPPAAKAVGVE